MLSFKKDEEFWFEDGTITLIVRDVEFRVYKGLLMGQSEVFRDMFSLPQPEIGSEAQVSSTIPVIRLDDSPDALRHVLRACMPVTDDSFIASENPSFNAIWALIHLGRRRQDEEVVGVVNLARFTGELTMLPTALLGCMMLGGGLVHGFEREDGGRETLSTDDQALLRARIRLCARIGPACRGSREYDYYSSAASERVVKLTEQVVRVTDPLARASSLFEKDVMYHCLKCHKHVEEWDNVERKRLWDQMPELLGVAVPGWEEAVKSKDDAAGKPSWNSHVSLQFLTPGYWQMMKME
ncbi:hypothetical protein C8T65DRAFT_722747 [Cerioporus squamosus]|nr:hypothetical protein C8T65DRAFT_722747 [Cerioporus squamosus]